jgi:ribokinase
MKIINFGALNIDHVYRVDHIACPGESVASADYSLFAGGKGANQSIAIARAGARVAHFGKIWYDGMWMVENKKKDGVDTTGIIVGLSPSGHANIMVDKSGQNAIVVFGGTNKEITTGEIDSMLSRTEKDDIILLQNEISNVSYTIKKAGEMGLTICINPAPMGPEVFSYPLEYISFFIINENEGEALSRKSTEGAILDEMLKRYPKARVVLTKGSKGAIYADASSRITIPGCKVTVVDTTGAGDAFIGYLMAGLQQGKPVKECLITANKAAAISVTRKGATASIPYADEVAKSTIT